MCIVVDKGIDIHDLDAVWWSFLTRGNLDTRSYVLSDLEGVADSNYGFSGYLGIDATGSIEQTLDRSTTPGEDAINLDDYFTH